jgi:hypothetical protein
MWSLDVDLLTSRLCGRDQEINRRNPLHMIAKESLRRLQWPIRSGHHVDRNRGLGDLDAELEQLAMDLGSAPQRVLKTHSSDEVAYLLADLRSAPERTGFPSPVGGKTRSMPTHNSLGPDDGNGVKYARTATIEPNEQSTVGPTQMQSMRRALPQDIELMPQNQNFGFELASRFEAVAQHANEKEANCNHAAIMF